MPNKTIYIRDDDTTTWEEAEHTAANTGQSMSALITSLLRDHLATAEPELVELTAEVHMVRIDGRYITRSIVDQLDDVEDSDCEPFGRFKWVETDDPYIAVPYIAVIGRGPDGSLVRSGRWQPDPVSSFRALSSAEADKLSSWQREYDEYRALPLILLAD